MPIATPRRSSGTRLTTSSAREGNSNEKPEPIAIAPRSATGSESVNAISSSPVASLSAAPTMHGIDPKRSGRPPPSTRMATTLAANAVNTAAPWPTPLSSRCRTMKAAIVA